MELGDLLQCTALLTDMQPTELTINHFSTNFSTVFNTGCSTGYSVRILHTWILQYYTEYFQDIELATVCVHVCIYLPYGINN